MKENGFKLTKERSRRYPAQTIMDVDNANDIALLANTPAQVMLSQAFGSGCFFKLNFHVYLLQEIQILVWFGLVLWHINHCWLFNAKSCLYIYINSCTKVNWLNWTNQISQRKNTKSQTFCEGEEKVSSAPFTRNHSGVNMTKTFTRLLS